MKKMEDKKEEKQSSQKLWFLSDKKLDNYWFWRGLWNSRDSLEKMEMIGELRNIQKKYLTWQIILHYFKNFFLFPLWLLRLLVPSYMKGKNNVFTNIKTIIMNKEFKPLRIAIISQFVFILILGVLGYTVLKNSQITKATDYSWTQSDWSGGEDQVTTADYDNNATNWTKYYSASSSLTIGSDVSLSFDIATSTDTTDTDFNNGTTSTVFVSSTGASASLVLLKPDGASCTTGNECSSSVCNGSNVCYSGPCSGLTSLDYSGQTYGLVEIGTQCWFSQNLNVGTMLASGATVPSNNSLIEKWCYNNSTANCTTYGGLYTWAEALQLDPSCNTTFCTPGTPSQGICPSGWHIPTDDEYKILEVYLGMCTGSGTGCVDAVSQWRGTDQGTQLKSGGNTNFNLFLAGYRSSGYFYYQNSFNNLLSSSESSVTASYAWGRYFSSSETGVLRNNNRNKLFGDPVRCLKD
ncbi:MAG: hypothetical protein COX80_04135 [Candidatus Magasanikbacteria bacterium CG_4_10_14_0_2_um_filter_33_14]|uniref:Fibrobacter succinogenes major paralogous domain-containing protein n=1 Tax=Candidatus Magasanikbacteria bacterium CG_4_10_14_0_2_um_filter_33_14 TaxID=1974636 RepID=A0A2M7V9J3_9BACT|nr:MAG: hypothetical protein COX80_04135 [Candidatus Magasanikbacteria bacterium CG_4_10_14_0_2_um_filter_33_14]